MNARTTTAIAVVAALGLGASLAGPALPASAKSINLKGLSNNINKAKHLTYYVQYKEVNGGTTSTVTIAQSPPKSYFGTSDSAVINNGKTTYYCTTNTSGNSGSTGSTGSTGTTGSSGNSGNSGATSTSSTTKTSSMQCYSEKGSTNPLLGLEGVFGTGAVLSVFSEAEQSAVAKALGIKVTQSSAKYAGQPSTCVTISRKGQGGKYCVTNKGLLAYTSTSKGNYFQMTKYSAKPPASLYKLPANATILSIPGTGSSGSSGSTP
jgi:hypothetical protein